MKLKWKELKWKHFLVFDFILSKCFKLRKYLFSQAMHSERKKMNSSIILTNVSKPMKLIWTKKNFLA